MRIEDLTDDDLPLDLGRYTLTGILGAGGMARVFEAEMQGELGFQRTVALKFVLAREGRDAEHLAQQLAHEARLGGLLDHPSLCQVFDCGLHEGVPFLAMEKVKGLTIDELVRRRGALPPHLALDVIRQSARALHAAHTATRQGEPLRLVHRDLKPSNLMVRPDGLVKVMDFGVARAFIPDRPETESGTMKGTPVYMAPEQMRGGPIDHRSDLFALGAVLWSLLTGRMLFGATSIPAVIFRVTQVDDVMARERRFEQVEALFAGGGDLLRGLLRADPAQRFPTALALAERIDVLIADLPQQPTLSAWVAGAVQVAGDREWRPEGDDTPARPPSGLETTVDHPDSLGSGVLTAPAPPGRSTLSPTVDPSPDDRGPSRRPWGLAAALLVAVLAVFALVAPDRSPMEAPTEATPAPRLADVLPRVDVPRSPRPEPPEVAAAWDDPSNLLSPPVSWLGPGARPGGTLRLATYGSVGINPLLGGGYLAAAMREYTQIPLFRGAPEDKASVHSELAYHLVEEDAGRTLVFRLRPDLYWHPPRDDLKRGVFRWGPREHPVTAHDVVFTLDMIAEPGTAANERLGAYLGHLERWEALDDHTLRVELSESSYVGFLILGEVFPLPRFLYRRDERGMELDDAAAFATVGDHWYGSTMLGCGPWRVAKHDPALHIELERNPDWPLGGDAFDAIHFELLEDAAVWASRLGEGRVDFATLPADVVRAEVLDAGPESPFRDGSLVEGTYDDNTWFFVAFNNERPWFGDVRVRRALNHSFHAERFLGEQMVGMGTRVSGPVPRHSKYYDESVPLPSFDLQRAAELLESAGWRDEDGDGVREGVADGKPMRLDFTIQLVPRRDEYQEIARLWAEDLARIGVRLRVRELTFPALLERAVSGEFDTMLMGRGGGNELAPLGTWHSRQIGVSGTSNMFRLRDDEVDRLAEALQVEFDPDERLRLGHAFHQRIAELAPGIFFYSRRHKAFWNPDLRDVGFQAEPPYENVRSWWFADGAESPR